LIASDPDVRPSLEDRQSTLTCPYCIGRQPIYDGARQIRGYELLYRRLPSDQVAVVSDADRASADVILKAFLALGLPHIAGGQLVYVNCTKALLGLDPILPPESCVLEVLEDVPADPETFRSLERLKLLGYRIALDDFVADDPRWPLVKLADHVKVDVRLGTPEEVRQLVAKLRGREIPVLAEKIETAEEFDNFRDWGCELFQGYYLKKPETISGNRVPSNRLSVLSLVAECSNPDWSVRSVAEAIGRDPSLTFGLLRLANSALFGGRGVRTLEGAVTALGIDRVYRLSILMVLADLNDGPPGYLEFALQRARASELIAGACGNSRYEAYMVGMLSTLDSILDMPLATVVESLPVDSALKEAIVQRSGPLGAILEAVLSYEGGDFASAGRLGRPLRELERCFWEAADYSVTTLASLAMPPAKAR
jgi:c-di-GMP phosphodiesterase